MVLSHSRGLLLSTRPGNGEPTSFTGEHQRDSTSIILSSCSRNLFGILFIYGSVNIGGWFVLEPFITPALYQRYPGAVDEWTISTLMAADTANGGLDQLEQHYDTFIVR